MSEGLREKARSIISGTREMGSGDFDDLELLQAMLRERLVRKRRVMDDPALAAASKIHYAENPWDFCRDWVVTMDPRKKDLGMSSMPFIPFGHQIEFLRWMSKMLDTGQPGICLKSRDGGVSWLCCAYAISKFLFNPGSVILFATKRENELDVAGNYNSLFEKMRHILRYTPPCFFPEGFDPTEKSCSKKNEIQCDSAESTISGMCGAEIGRGWRGTMAVIDEAAFIENQEKAAAALSEASNTIIRVSTPARVGDLFHQDYVKWKKSCPERIFEFHWKNDKRKGAEWYEKRKMNLTKETLAREVDMSFAGANLDAFLDPEWVNACVDAHKRLGFPAAGEVVAGFDPSDIGHANAFVVRRGEVCVSVDQVRNRADSQMDISMSFPWAFDLAERSECRTIIYDADGMGSTAAKMYRSMGHVPRGLELVPFSSKSSPLDRKEPVDLDDPRSKTNEEAFVNRRAQAWESIRRRMSLTHRSLQMSERGMPIGYVRNSDIISISSECENLHELISELCAPKRVFNNTGKIQVEAKENMRKRGIESPNLADAFVYAFSGEPHGDDFRGPSGLDWEVQPQYDPAAGF